MASDVGTAFLDYVFELLRVERFVLLVILSEDGKTDGAHSSRLFSTAEAYIVLFLGPPSQTNSIISHRIIYYTVVFKVLVEASCVCGKSSNNFFFAKAEAGLRRIK